MTDEIYFHFTTKEGAEGIKKSGKIKPSLASGKDAVMGTGVYVNQMNPTKHSKSEIARNNYDDGSAFWQQQKADGKVDHVVAMKLPSNTVEKMKSSGRDVGVHKDEIDLRRVPHRIIKVTSKE